MPITREANSVVTPSRHDTSLAVGMAYGLGAYGFWGLAPVYFKLIAHVPPLIVLAHRITWSVVFVGALVTAARRWPEVRRCLGSGRTMLLLLASTVMIAVNWFTFIWAVSNNQVVAASLGYFMCPLVSVLLGVLVLGERLRPAETIAVMLAAIAGGVMLSIGGQVGIVSVTLALSFSLYGLLRKRAIVAPQIGMLVETMILLPLACALVWRQVQTSDLDGSTWILLVASGVVTAVPLIWFAAAARRLPLSTLGFLQYISPTGQFLLGVLVYREPFGGAKLAGFMLIWVALGIFLIDQGREFRRRRALRRDI
jgi:chloramphenicol-sensitive protein RarD